MRFSSPGLRRLIPSLGLTALLACGGGDKAPAAAGAQAPAAAATGDLTPFQQEHGIGPITTVVQLGPVDAAQAAEGKTLFETKCSACHKLTDKYVGPPLGEVTTRRSATYIMNMILNPEGMYTKHPVARQLLGEYMTQMPNLGLTEAQARQLVEYLRTQVTQ